MRALSDLEALTLATLEQRKPCTAYAVRRCFRESPSAHFSDSAGSVYPLLERLLARGLVRTRVASRGRRAARAFLPTARGLAALQDWLRVPDEPAELVTFDPLRSRLLYLALLAPAERRRWLDEAEAALKRHAATIASLAERERALGDPFLELAHENTQLTVQARLEWIHRARRRLNRS
jgi:DNA-binding PadR family transcriptional regulator